MEPAGGREPGSDAAVVTDLLDERRSPAADPLAIHLTRWRIENVLRQIAEVFHPRRRIGRRPPAALFHAPPCPVLFNVPQLVRGYTTAGRPEPTAVEDVPGERIVAGVTRDRVGLHEVLTTDEVIGGVPVTGCDGRGLERGVLGGLWSPKWGKVWNTRTRPVKPPPRKSGGHTSVHKPLQQNETQPIARPSTPRS